MVFFLVLLVLFWGGMINGIMMLLGVWEKLWDDLVICFLIVVLLFYGMFIFEGLMMVIKIVNVFFYYMDWIIGYVYFGVLGWVVMIIIGLIYVLVFWFYGKKEMYSVGLVNIYFWLVILGVVFYIIVMWVVGIF